MIVGFSCLVVEWLAPPVSGRIYDHDGQVVIVHCAFVRQPLCRGCKRYSLFDHCLLSTALSHSIQTDFAELSHNADNYNYGDHGMAKGTVKWFNATKGFGFIAPEGGGSDVFVHISALERANLSSLDDDQKVTFDIESGRDGRESATNLALA